MDDAYMNELVISAKKGDSSAEVLLWENVEKFVRMMAGKKITQVVTASANQKNMVEEDDLYQVGFFALREAVAHYDEKEGRSFIGYFNYWLMNEFNKALNWRTAKEKNDPLNNYVSLNKLVGDTEGESVELLSLIPDPDDPYQQIENDDLWRSVRKYLNTAIESVRSNRGRVLLKYLLDHDFNVSIKEAGETLFNGEVSSTRVYQIYKETLKELRGYMTRSTHRMEIAMLGIDEYMPNYSGSLRTYKYSHDTSCVERTVLKREEIRSGIRRKYLVDGLAEAEAMMRKYLS